MRAIVAALFAAILITASGMAISQPVSCGTEPLPNTFGGTPVWRAGDALGFVTPKLAVDADGAPNSYRVDGNGLSFTCDGVLAIENGQKVTPHSDPQHWQQKCRDAFANAQKTGDYSGVSIFGFLTNKNGAPVVQGPGDPLPNEAYVTTTSLTVPNTPDQTQRHWVDAVQIPYLVLSPAFAKAANAAPGDVAVVYRPRTDAMAFAVYAECCDLGEASVRLHQDLKNDPLIVTDGISRARRGIDDKVVTVVFGGHHPAISADASAWNQRIQEVGQAALKAWGGSDRLKACAQ